MANDISLYCQDDILIISITGGLHEGKPTATIINYSGETVARFYLKHGINSIEVSGYSGKNYAVRVQQGNNVLVQKI